MAKFLKLPSDKLSKLVDLQRMEELKRDLGDHPRPVSRVRELILASARLRMKNRCARFFEKQAFGELERLVTQSFRTSSRESQKKLEGENCSSGGSTQRPKL